MSDELQMILDEHRPKAKGKDAGEISRPPVKLPSFSEIPDLIFDEVLVKLKLTRTEIMLLIYLYRQVWCRPNPYRDHGISGLLAYGDVARSLNVHVDEIYHTMRRLEELSLISILRPGQYFIRKYLTKEYDEQFGVGYDDFENP